MSYIDGKPVLGSNSPFTVWLRCAEHCVLSIDYQELNRYISEYNRNRLYKYGVNFWGWLSYNLEYNRDDYTILGLDSIWNDGNPNLCKVGIIKKGD